MAVRVTVKVQTRSHPVLTRQDLGVAREQKSSRMPLWQEESVQMGVTFRAGWRKLGAEQGGVTAMLIPLAPQIAQDWQAPGGGAASAQEPGGELGLKSRQGSSSPGLSQTPGLTCLHSGKKENLQIEAL